MEGYKGFRKGLICKNKQYAENTVFEEPKAILCKCCMHFCKNPMDVLYYYEFIDSDGEITEFAKVEALDEPKTDNDKKYCSTKLKIHEKISFEEFIDICINSLTKNTHDNSSDNYIQIRSSGYHNALTENKYSQIANSGYYSIIASSGPAVQIVNSGKRAQIASSGNLTQIVNSKELVKIASSGDHTLIGDSGESAKIANSGDYTQIRNSGDYAHIVSSGKYVQIRDSGNIANIANAGFGTQIVSSGKYAQIASSGNVEKIISEGEHSVICCAGNDSKVKAKKGSWITLTEWEYNKDGTRIPKCVKTEYVDGERIKEDVFYMLVNGEFVEAIG